MRGRQTQRRQQTHGQQPPGNSAAPLEERHQPHSQSPRSSPVITGMVGMKKAPRRGLFQMEGTFSQCQIDADISPKSKPRSIRHHPGDAMGIKNSRQLSPPGPLHFFQITVDSGSVRGGCGRADLSQFS